MLQRLKDIIRPWVLLVRSPAMTSYAQHGEDVMIARFWQGLGRNIADLAYLDVGANHPKYISGTYGLYKLGARGVAVEPNPALAKVWRFLRPHDLLVEAGASFDGKRGVADYWSFRRHTLNTFDEASAKSTMKMHPDEKPVKHRLPLIPWAELLKMGRKKPDLIVLDTEGLDERLVAAYPFRSHRPTMFCVETLEYAKGRGRRLDAVFAAMQKHGYVALMTTDVNTIFVDGKVLGK